ncbi:MAG TPA: thioredoxin family protein [Clostridiaceae bacterium]
MKVLTILITDWCPHCNRAIKWLKEIKEEDSRFKEVEITIIDEEKQPELSEKFDYYYVPTYYVDGVKIHEGATSKDQLIEALEVAVK